MQRTLLVFFALLFPGCLPRVSPGEHDGSPDAAQPGPRVVRVRVTDENGTEWPLDAIPQRPHIHVMLSEPPDGALPAWVFIGGTEDLLDDLSESPLRAASQDRIAASTLDGGGLEWVITPLSRLPPGTITVGVGAWLEGAWSGRKMGAPWVSELSVSGAPEAGARPTASWPPDGAAAVPTSMAELIVRFDGAIANAAQGLELRRDDGSIVAGTAREVACLDHGWDDGACASFVPALSLAPGQVHELRVTERLLDATGAPIGPWRARFTTATADDEEPPALLAQACALDESVLEGACLLADDAHLALRIHADEPVRVELRIAERSLHAVAARGSATLAVRELAPSTSFSALLTLEDMAGHTVTHSFTLATTEPLLTLSITEARADPLGPEPRQEYVEVLNYGAVTMELVGISLSDRTDSLGDVVLGSQRLLPGQRALLVPDDFDPEDPSDPPVPAAIPLVRMGRSLGGGGLSNSGEPLYLRDAAMHRLSAAPAMSSSAGSCVVRTQNEEPRGANAFAIAACTPGVP